MGDDLRAHLATPFHLAEVRVDPASLRIVGPQGTRRLEPRVMDVLVALAARAPEPISRNELIEAVWGAAAVTDGVLSRCVSILRDLLGDDRAQPRFIETVSKRGYRLLAQVNFVEDAPAAPEPAGLIAQATAHPTSIVVLPFVNLAVDASDEHIADGLTELMIANLASVASLRVIARTTSMVYKKASKRVRDIAAELDVDYVIEGSVCNANGRMQVVAQLIEAHSELHAWAHTYTRELRDVLTLLNEIARSVAKAVSARLLPSEMARLDRQVVIGEDALQHYLKGRYFWAQRGPEALERAGEEFAAAAGRASHFAPAHCGLADCQIMVAMYGYAQPLTAATLAREHLARALALDPDSAEVQTAHGAVKLFFDWNLDEAERAFVHALSRNPSYTTAHLAYGDLMMIRGEFERGLALIREAVKLSPFDLGLNMNAGDFLIFSGDFDGAVSQLEHTLALDERFVPGRLRLAEALALSAHDDEALAHAEHALVAAPTQPRVRETYALVLAATGRCEAARRELDVLATERDRRYVSAWDIARAFAVMSDADAALAWLAVAVNERAPLTLFARVHPALDPIRDDARLSVLLNRSGLPPAPAGRVTQARIAAQEDADVASTGIAVANGEVRPQSRRR